MTDFRARLEWVLWCAALAGVTAGWAASTFDAAGRPSTTLTPALWISPAVLVLLACWWRGLRGVTASVVGVMAGATLFARLESTSPFDLTAWSVIGGAMVSGYGIAGLVLRRTKVELCRPGLRDVALFVAVAVVVAPVVVGSVIGVHLAWTADAGARVAAARALATIDMSAIVVVVPVAFIVRDVLRNRRARGVPRRAGRAGVRVRPSDGARSLFPIVVAIAVVAVVAVAIAAVSVGGIRADVLVGGLLVLALAGLAEERRRGEIRARETAADLELGHARLRSIMDTVPDGVLVLDALGRVESTNDLAARMFAADPGALAGHSLLELLPPPQGVDPAMHLVEVLSSRGDGAGSVVHAWDARTLDGRTFSLELSVSRMGLSSDAHRWGYVATVRENTDRRRREQQLAHRAIHDDLTQLPNRLLFQDRLEQALAGLQSKQTGLALLLVDVDRREIDRLLGGLAGDRVVTEVARRVRECVRSTDTVARLGDDELAVLCTPCASPAVAADLAQRLVDRLALPHDRLPIGLAPRSHVGVVTTDDADARPDHLLAAADDALGSARLDAARRWAMYEPMIDVRDPATGSTRIVAGGTSIDLRDVLTADHIAVRYQPILDLATGTATSIEALARLRGADGVLIAPAQFVPQAEQAGLIERLSAVVLPQALSDLSALRNDEAAPDLRVSMNVSPRQLNADLVELVRDALRNESLPGSALMLEITEAAPLAADADTLRVVRELRSMGVGVALDDFGQGFSRLELVREMPLDALKIDRSCVQRLADSAFDRDIVEMVVSISRRRGLMVIAEGIETIDHIDAVTRLGCTHAQGYLFGQPMDIDELRYLLREWQIVPAIAAQAAIPLKER